MKVVLDHNLPRQLKPFLPDHEVFTAREMKWDALSNGNLLAATESAGFDVMVTGDQNLYYQQNDPKRVICLIVLTEIDRRFLLGYEDLILMAIERSNPGGYEVVVIPNPKKLKR